MLSPDEQYYNHLKIEQRCVDEGQWLIDNPKTSLRKLAEEFLMSKSQVHRDLNALKHIDDDMYVQCKHILKSHSLH